MALEPKASQTKYQAVAANLRCEIEAGRWDAGDQLPGSNELARYYGVAYMTVRQAVESLVDEGVLIRIRGKGTFVAITGDSVRSAGPAAAGVADESSNQDAPAGEALTLLFHAWWLPIDPYYLPGLLDGFTETIKAHGYRAALADYAAAESADKLAPESAVACLLVHRHHFALLERLRENGHKVLAINHYTGPLEVPCVRIDDAQGIGAAVAHLASLGHRRIGFLRGDPTHLDSMDRLRGFRAALKRCGVRAAGEGGDGFTEEAGYRGASEILSLPNPPTAIVCAGDRCALGAAKAARERGLSIPGDLSLVGFGDLSVAAFMHPALTTVRQARSDLGHAAAEALISLARGEEPTGAVLSAPLVVRESTAPCRDRSQ